MRGCSRTAAAIAAAVLAAASAAFVSALAVAVLAPGSPLAATCAGAGPNHAALVAEHADGSVVTRCVAFEAASITGEQLLDSSGVAWSGETFGGNGRAVCAIDSEPARYASCPGSDSYWAIFDSGGSGKWQLSAVGISSLKLADGDAEGFRYVSSAGDPAPPPPAAGVCSAGASSGGGSDAVAPTRAGAATPGAAAGLSGPRSTAAAPSSGFDIGWMAAALVGVGLGGLALLRLFAARRRST